MRIPKTVFTGRKISPFGGVGRTGGELGHSANATTASKAKVEQCFFTGGGGDLLFRI